MGLLGDSVGFTDRALKEKQRIADHLGCLLQFRDIPVGFVPLTTTTAATVNTNDAFVNGGGGLSTGGIDLYGRSVIQNILTQPGSITFFAKILGPTSTRTAEVGLINNTQNHVICIITDFAFATDGTTKYLLRTIEASTITSTAGTNLIAADQEFHYFTMEWDTVTLFAYCDGLPITSFLLTNQVDEPLYPFAFSSTAADVSVCEGFVGFLQP